MKLKLVLLLIFTLSYVVILKGSNDHKVGIASTTEHDFQNQEVKDRLNRLEEKLQFQMQLNEYSRRLERNDLRFQQITDRLTALEEQMESQKKLNETVRRLQALELQNEKDLISLKNQRTKLTDTFQGSNAQIQKKLENIEEVLTNVTSRYAENNKNEFKLETLELQNKELRRKLEHNVIPRNCKEVRERGFSVSQIYRIQPEQSSKSFLVMCNMDVRRGGWTYVLNRYDGSQNFNLAWNDYKNGFGNQSREFWLGLEHVHHMTDGEPNELLIELVDWDQKQVHALYNNFKISNESEGYYLKSLGTYSGDAGDNFFHHIGAKFSTKDKEQSNYAPCAARYSSGWWYTYYCYYVHLTGKYLKGEVVNTYGTSWEGFHGWSYSLKEVRMMIRPRDTDA